MRVRVQNVQLRVRGVLDVLRLAPVQALTDSAGQRLAVQAGELYKYKPLPHKYTSRGYVTWALWAGRHDEAKNGTLSKVFGANVTQ